MRKNMSGDVQRVGHQDSDESPLDGESKARQPRMEEDLTGFNIAFAISQVLGITCVVLVTVWTTVHGNGFAWRSEPAREFNWHPLLMTVGFIFLYANSIMIYRSLRALRKQQLKLIHAALPVIVLFCIIIAQFAVFDFHNFSNPPIPNLYSLHSWIGLIAIALYFVQWISGLIVYLFPRTPLALRARLMPWHIYSGLTIFVVVIAAALTGLNEKAIFKLGQDYGARASEGVLINFIGLFFILFAASVVFIVTHYKFKRYPRPEDGPLLGPKSPVSD